MRSLQNESILQSTEVAAGNKTREANWRARAGSVLKRVAAVGLASTVAFGVTVLEARPAQASVGCYGDWCSGKDPEATGCAADAETLAESEVFQDSTVVDADGGHDQQDSVGELQLRWSPTCKTKWARLALHKAADITGVVAKQDTGYKQSFHTGGWWGATGPSISYTPMIYSPGEPVYAYADGFRLSGNSTEWR